VVNPDSSLARCSASAAISSGFPSLPMGATSANPRRRKAVRSTEILAAAREVFSAKPYEAASISEIAALKDAEAFDDAIDIVGTWSREDKRAATKVLLQALVDKRIGRRDQAQAWVWRLASYTRELHEEYAVQRWPETKRLLGLLVNSSGRAHGKNARKLVQAVRKQDRRLAVSLLAAAVAHTPEGEEVLRGARMRMARKPSAVARELLRNFPKGGKKRRRRRKGKGAAEGGAGEEGCRRAGEEGAGAAREEATARPIGQEREAREEPGCSAEWRRDRATGDGERLTAGRASAEPVCTGLPPPRLRPRLATPIRPRRPVASRVSSASSAGGPAAKAWSAHAS